MIEKCGSANRDKELLEKYMANGRKWIPPTRKYHQQEYVLSLKTDLHSYQWWFPLVEQNFQLE